MHNIIRLLYLDKASKQFENLHILPIYQLSQRMIRCNTTIINELIHKYVHCMYMCIIMNIELNVHVQYRLIATWILLA